MVYLCYNVENGMEANGFMKSPIIQFLAGLVVLALGFFLLLGFVDVVTSLIIFGARMPTGILFLPLLAGVDLLIAVKNKWIGLTVLIVGALLFVLVLIHNLRIHIRAMSALELTYVIAPFVVGFGVFLKGLIGLLTQRE